MPDYFERTRAALRNLLGTRPAAGAAGAVVAVPIGNNLVLADGRVVFADPERAASNPTAWLALFEAALERNVAVGDAALELVRAQASRLSTDTLPWGSLERSRMI